MSEVLRIIRCGAEGNPKKVRAYAMLLADKLDSDGETTQAARIRRIFTAQDQHRITLAANREELFDPSNPTGERE